MVFGLFGKKSTKEKALAKAKKALSRGMAADARLHFEEVLDQDPQNAEALEGLEASVGALVRWNIEESQMCADHEPAKARECAELAVELAGDFKELAKEAKAALDALGKAPAPKRAPEKSERLFEPSCGSSCGSGCGSDHGEEEELDMTDDELFEFYMGTVSEEECEALEYFGADFRAGYVALQQGEGPRARKLLKKAEAQEEATAGISYAFGLLEEMEGKNARADKHFKEALARAPEFMPALSHLVASLMEQGRPADAADMMEEYLAGRDPGEELTTTFATVNLVAGRVDRARELCEPLAETSMSNPMVALTWARVLKAQGDAEGSIRAFQAASAQLKDSMEVLLPMGELMVEQGGRWAEHAVKVFKHCYRIDRQNGWYYLLATARAYAARGWGDEARKMAEAAREELPEHPDALKAWQSVSEQLSA